jgi:integrase
MAIKAYEKNNKTYFEVYVSRRSKNDPSIRIQKRRRDLSTRAAADRLEKEFIFACAQEIQTQESRGQRWGEIVDRWQQSRRSVGDVMQDTVDDYISMMKHWTQQIWVKHGEEITRADVREAVEAVRAAGRSNSYQAKVLHTIGRIHRWAREEGIIKSGPASIIAGIKVSRIEEKVPEILSWKQLSLLLDEAKARESFWYPIWATAVFTGMRNGELYALKWSDVDLSNDLITVGRSYNKRKRVFKSTKSGYFRTVPINTPLKSLLLELKTSAQTEYVLPRNDEWNKGYQARALRLFCKELGLPSIRFHGLRACFATHLLGQGVSVGIVKKICGWSDLETMERYVRLAGLEERGATECLNQLAPRSAHEAVVSLENFR